MRRDGATELSSPGAASRRGRNRLISKRFSRKTGLLQNVLREDLMYRSAVGCIVFSIAAPYLISMLGSAAARVNSAFGQLNQSREPSAFVFPPRRAFAN